MERAGGLRGEAAEGGGMSGEREGPAGGRARGTGKGGGGGVHSGASRGLRGGDNQATGRRGCRPRRPAFLAAVRTDRPRCVQEAPGHVQPELPEKTLQPLGECPPPERGRSPGAPGPPRAPLPGLLVPGGRAPVAPGKPAPQAGGGKSGAHKRAPRRGRG